ncbi:MAG TPA: APC family permease [Chitinophagaceae bacterium]|jgi:APA family basic amino acid/polyamine antiporter|nr:APC family permease [Chitinophagaceae bacterium]
MTQKNKLGLFDFTMIVIGLVIGMGIFRTAKDAAGDALNPTIYFAAWIVGGIIALCGALTYAEIGSRYPVTGGYYRVFSYAYHPSIAFALNASILISNAASVSGVALIGAGYISKVFFGPDAGNMVKVLIAMSAIFIFYGVNMMGLKLSAKTQSVLMLIKISMILLLISALFFVPAFESTTASTVVSENTGWQNWIKSFGLCLIAVSFTYGGYQQTINFGSEVNQPSKNVPKAIFIGIAVIIILYLTVNVAYYKIVGFENMKSTGEIASVVVEKMFGLQGANIFSGLLFLSVLAYVNVSLLSNPRVMFAMSEDGVFPKIFRKQNEQKGVMVVSLTIFAAVCVIVLFFADTFEKILSFSIFLDSFGMATSAATIFMLRKRTKHLDGTGIYKMKFFPLQPIVFIAAYIFVCASIISATPGIALTGTAVLVGFTLLYFLIKPIKRADQNS